MNKTIDATKLHEALNLLHDQLILLNAPPSNWWFAADRP